MFLKRPAGSLLPRLPSAGLGLKPHGWPAPFLDEPLAEELTTDAPPGVPFAPLTLAGVELALSVSGADRFASQPASLRFDLTALGELFAEATIEQPKQDARAPPNDAPPLAVSALDPQGLAEVWRLQAEKLARTRTILDRVTPWSASGGQVAISGLIEPFIWNARFTFSTRNADGLPIGAYRLGDIDYSGIEAVKGLTKTFTGNQLTPGIADKTVQVVGMAARARDMDDRFVDMRALGVAKLPKRKGEAQWRDVALEGAGASPRSLATLRVDFGNLSFEARDLPMVVTASAASFTADLTNGGDPEGRISVDGRMLIRANLANGIGEWRLFEQRPRP